jgi:hypothetical protein
MNREQRVLTALLDVLADWSEPLDEAVLHAQMNQVILPAPASTLAEFSHARTTASNAGWITCVDSQRRGNLWSLTNKGRAERHA